MGTKNKLLKKHKPCKWWVECDDCSGRVSDEFEDKVDADRAALKHRAEKEGHHPKTATNCIGG